MTTAAERDVLIVGAGHAAAMVAVGLRQKGFGGSILMVGEEAALPYERPPLSKAYLAGKLEPHRLFLRKAEFWQERAVEVRTQTTITRLDPSARTATLSTGEAIRYGWCILATGGRVRPLPCPGAHLPGVHYLRTLVDVDGIRASLTPGARLAVIGGGYIGLEVAASARKLGHEVTLIEALDRVLARVTSPVVSRFFEAKHQAEGVDVRLNTAVAAIEGETRVTGVALACGEVIPADVVVVGIGILPNCELAQDAGLACDNGIMVDDLCRTADPRILAIGDVARHPNRYAPGGPVRLESVQNAVDQAKTAVSVILGAPEPYADLPWFWSDQYDIKLQTAGLALDYDEIIVRGTPDAAPFSVLYLRAGRVVAIDCINSIKDFMAGKKLVTAGLEPDRTLLCNPAFPLKDLMAVPA
ncbi:NAD(P)/FAD-dependent oxidoreductase [Pedomonas mirosovicensis]|uniref:NAD(P)/FAD-dependent oxidoreductase n=1 Tax=Pedomonas mirosovicensis TaxID=2908641 RepID=UPI002168678D|nr:FAD-dependent oxidoreductase [Pedomonas mirosovicensis]MCH8684702.1 FAD-dependent oxidoreductase [Pedomonas mirosovicensis]